MADDEVRTTTDTGATSPPGADERDAASRATSGETSDSGSSGGERQTDGLDLRGIVKQFTAPMLESLDSRLREQVEAHVDELLTTKVEAAIADRLQTIDRAIAALSRSLDDLERRVSGIERSGEELD